MIFVLTGNGKGKTTCALGMGMRAVGAGRKVLMVQFLKPPISSELEIIKRVRNFKARSFGRKGFLRKENFPFSKEDFKLAKQGFEVAKEALKTRQCNFLILDEINPTLYFKLLPQKEVLEFLKKYAKNFDIVLTGRKCPKKIIDTADLVTEFKEVKHYYRIGKKARKGIEF